MLIGLNLFSDGVVGCAPCVLVACKEAVENCDLEISVSVVVTATLNSLVVTAIWMTFATK